jgi:hypothetical protein
MPAIGVKSLPLNVSDLEICAKRLSDFGLKSPSAAPQIDSGRKMIAGVKYDAVGVRAHPGLGEDSNDIRPEPLNLSDIALIPAQLNCPARDGNFPGFELHKLEAIDGNHPLRFEGQQNFKLVRL